MEIKFQFLKRRLPLKNKKTTLIIQISKLTVFYKKKLKPVSNLMKTKVSAPQ